jgi:hypothetical protein
MQHQFGPWIFVAAAKRLPFGASKYMYTFLRAHESEPTRAIDLLRGFGATEAEAARDAASCLVDEAGLPLTQNY